MDGAFADRFLGASPNAGGSNISSGITTATGRPTALRRMTSTSSSVRRTTTFSDFLSDSDDDDDDDDGGVSRMQAQADDMTYFQDASFTGGAPSPLGVDDNRLSIPMNPANKVPTPTTRATTTTRKTFGRLTRTTSTSRKTVGRLTSVKAPAVLRRLTSLKKRKKKGKAGETDARGTLSDVEGVIMDSDESASDRGSDHGSDKLSVYSEHDSDFSFHNASGNARPVIPDDRQDGSFYHNDRSFVNDRQDNDRSFVGNQVHNNDRSFVSRREDNDRSFASSHGGNDRSFASSHGGNDDSFVGGNDHSFASSHGGNDDSFVGHGDSFRYAGDGNAEVDNSFSSAMAYRPRQSDDDDDVYDNDGYDAEEEEQRRREKEAEVREEEQEEELRLSEEPFSRTSVRVSTRISTRMSTRITTVGGFGDIEENPYASSSFDSVSSSGDQFFVESVRGSTDSIAPIMDLPASPAQFSEISNGSGSAHSSLSSSPPSLLARGSPDLSFRSSFVPVTQLSAEPEVTQPAPAALGFRVVDHTEKSESKILVSSVVTSLDRDSSSSSSSGDSVEDASFYSNIDDSFTERPRSSSEDDLSFVFKKHVTSVSDDPAAIADAIAAVDTTARKSASKHEDDSFVSHAVPSVEVPSVPKIDVASPKKTPPPAAAPLPTAKPPSVVVPPKETPVEAAKNLTSVAQPKVAPSVTVEPLKEISATVVQPPLAPPSEKIARPVVEPKTIPPPAIQALKETPSSAPTVKTVRPAVIDPPKETPPMSAPVIKTTPPAIPSKLPSPVMQEAKPISTVKAPQPLAQDKNIPPGVLQDKKASTLALGTSKDSSAPTKQHKTMAAVASTAVATTLPKDSSPPVAQLKTPPTVAVAPPVVPVKIPPPAVNSGTAVSRDSAVPTDIVTRKTAKFARPLPPARKRGPPHAKQVAAAAAASTVAATASIVKAVATAASPPNPSSGIIDASIVSRASDVRLDFTGVFMGDAEDLNNSRVEKKAVPVMKTKTEVPDPKKKPDAKNKADMKSKGDAKNKTDAKDKTNVPDTKSNPKVPDVARQPELEPRVKDSSTATAKAEPSSLRRTVTAQAASERKVEEFFRKTYLENEDDDMSDFMLRSGRGRSKTAANRGMAGAALAENMRRDDPLLTSKTRSRRSSTSAMQMVDLKHVKGQRIEELLRANEEETKDGDDDGYSDLAASEVPARKRTLSRPSARFPVNEDLLEEKFPLRPSTASSVALANRQPPPQRPNGEPLTPMSFYSVTSGSEYTSSLPDSEVPLNHNVIQRNFTLSLASGTVGRSSFSISPQTESSPNEIPMPPNYMLSPRLNNHRPSSSLGSISTDESESAFGKSAGLPTLIMNSRPVVTTGSDAAAAASAKLASSGFGASQFAASHLRSPNPMAASSGVNSVAPGFRWHPELSHNQPQTQPLHAPGTKQSHDSNESSEDGSLSIKESVWHAAGALSIGSARPSMSASVMNHFHRASATLKNSFQRVREQFIPPRGNNDVTSPKSIVSAPPQLPRGFDDREFYKRLGNIVCGDAMIVVSKGGRGNSAKEAAIARSRKTRAWLLLLGTLFGIVMGVGMSHIDALAPQFRIQVNDVTGEMTLSTAARWLLFPGSLFLRIWNCVAIPLLFCQVVNGIAELAMTNKAKSALSPRAIAYFVVTAALTTIEGVGMTVVYHTLGLFKGKQVGLRVAAASVKQSVNVLDRVKGMASMMCAAGETYLQISQDGQEWSCSNETIPLPVQKGINISGQSWIGSSPAVFSFTELPTVMSAAVKSRNPASVTSSSVYYPATTSSVGDVITEIITVLSPSNVMDSFSKSMASSVVVIGVIFGLVVGLRAFYRSIAAQHHLQQSQTQQRTKDTALAENILAKPHPVLGVMVELQQLLEWLAESLQSLAPIGVASLLMGHIMIHRDEWFAISPPAFSLILGVTLASLIHIIVLSPLLVKLFTGVNAWKTLTSFLPAMCLSFGTGNVVLSVPLLAENFESAQVVTKSMSQVGAGLAAAVLRTGHALYYPLAMLFLLETTTPHGAVPMSAKFVLLLAGLAFLSCFFAVSPGPKLGLPGVTASAHLQLVLVLFRGWTKQQLTGAATMPLLVVADIVIGHVVAMVSTNDHVAFSRLLAEHCAELCIPPSDATLGVGASPIYL